MVEAVNYQTLVDQALESLQQKAQAACACVEDAHHIPCQPGQLDCEGCPRQSMFNGSFVVNPFTQGPVQEVAEAYREKRIKRKILPNIEL